MPMDHDQQDAARQGMFGGQQFVDGVFSQLVGLCRGVLADNHLADSEIVALDQWIETYGHRLPEWPVLFLARRIRAALQDGLVEEQERADLLDFMQRMVGQPASERHDDTTTLPLTDPPPHISYEGTCFCLTGTFVYGRRRDVEEAIKKRGGKVAASVSRKVNYLVIGGTITPAWKYSTHGLKIEKAVELVHEGHPIGLVSEEHWVTSLC